MKQYARIALEQQALACHALQVVALNCEAMASIDKSLQVMTCKKLFASAPRLTCEHGHIAVYWEQEQKKSDFVRQTTIMWTMTARQPKLSILVEESQMAEIAEAVELRARRRGDVTKPKLSSTLREVLVAWARDEKRMSQEGTLFESDGVVK